MNITYIVSTFPKLSEKFILDQITGLIDRGHKLRIIAAGKTDETISHEAITQYQLLDKTVYLKKSPECPGFWFDAELISLLLDTELIHAHFADFPTELAQSIAKITGIPFIFTAHAYDIFISPNQQRLASMFESANAIITVSNYNKKYLLTMLGEQYASKLEVVHCGIKLDEFTPQKNKTASTKPIILSVGRLIEKKGMRYALEAFAKICQKQPQLGAKYYIIGDGPLKQVMQAQIDRLKLTGSITLLGHQTSQTILEYLRQADVFVLPSVTASNGDREGIPTALLEAQAMQIPVVSTLHSGIAEGVLADSSGFLVPEQDVDTLAEKLEVLLLNPKKRQQMGKAGRVFISKNFDHETSLNQLESIFRNTLAKLQPNKTDKSIVLAMITELIKQKDHVISEKNTKINLLQNEIATATSRLMVLERFYTQVINSLPHKIYRTIFKPLLRRNKP